MIENSENHVRLMEVPPNFFTCLDENESKIIATWNSSRYFAERKT